jgi:large subunit ribosomal protein L2
MGKRIISQRRGKGSLTYRVRKKAFTKRIGYPRDLETEGTLKVIRLLNSLAHSAPLAKIKYSNGTFYIPACNGMFEGQKINVGLTEEKIENGTIAKLGDLNINTKIYNIESRPNDGGRFIRTGGSNAEVIRKTDKEVLVVFPSKKRKSFDPRCKATVGVCGGHGRLEKPMVKAGRMFHLKKSKSKLWPRTSACKMNAIDHPFGSGRGKVPKPRIAKRNSAPGQKVGLIRPKRTGKRK